MEIKQNFVENMPEELDEDILYISLKHRTTSHMCPCGCKNKISASLNSTGWSFIYDGSSSLDPSISNDYLPCKSHYWIKHNQIQWVTELKDAEYAPTIETRINFMRVCKRKIILRGVSLLKAITKWAKRH